MRVSRRTWIVLAVLAGLVLAACAGFSPAVRALATNEASKRRLELEIGQVRPGWFAVTLRDVHVRLQGVRGVDVQLTSVQVDLGASLRARSIDAQGGNIALTGSAEELSDALRAWRGEKGAGGDGASTSTPWHVDGISIAWTPVAGAEPALTAQGVSLERGTGYKLGVEGAKAKHGDGAVEVATLSVELDAKGTLVRAKSTRMQLSYDFPAQPDAPAAPAVSPLDPAPPPLPVVAPSKKKGRVPAPVPASPIASTPLLPLPDLHALRQKAAAVAAALASRLPEGGLVEVDGLELSLGIRGDRIALGPGPFRVERTTEDVRVSFATGDAAGAKSTRLSLDGTLPIAAGDVTVQLAGGPVALSLLGVKNGAMGLTDVERATLAGTGRVVVAARGDSMTFDVDVKVRGLAVKHPKLAADTVRGLDFGVAARGLLDDKGQLRLDDAELAMGALHLRGRGALDEAPDHLSAALNFDVPTAACQLLLDSVPSALLPTLRGARVAGTFGARGRLAFDTRKLDDLALDYSIADECRMMEVPGDLSRDRFTKAFSHHVYAPDGRIDEELTGPGTASWTDLDHISPFMQVAVLTTEDGAFHHASERPPAAHGGRRKRLVLVVLEPQLESRGSRVRRAVPCELRGDLVVCRRRAAGRAEAAAARSVAPGRRRRARRCDAPRGPRGLWLSSLNPRAGTSAASAAPAPCGPSTTSSCGGCERTASFATRTSSTSVPGPAGWRCSSLRSRGRSSASTPILRGSARPGQKRVGAVWATSGSRSRRRRTWASGVSVSTPRCSRGLSDASDDRAWSMPSIKPTAQCGQAARSSICGLTPATSRA